jgi:hypothetical protein
MPLLIIAELVVHERMRHLLQQFLERKLIPENTMPRFAAAIASAFRFAQLALAEVLLIALVYGVGVLIVWRQYMTLDADTWYADTVRRWLDALARGDLVWLCEPADVPVSAGSLVLPPVHLDALSVAGIAHAV